MIRTAHPQGLKNWSRGGGNTKRKSENDHCIGSLRIEPATSTFHSKSPVKAIVKKLVAHPRDNTITIIENV